MGTLSVYYLDDDNGPVIYSFPAHSDPDGYVHEASVTLKPWGPSIPRRWDPETDPEPPQIKQPEKATIGLSFLIDEAEVIARRLLEVVVAARDGKYSPEGVEIVEGIAKQRLDDA